MPTTTVLKDGGGANFNLVHNTNGQAAMAASKPVVIASDQSAVPVSGSVSISGGVGVTGTFWQATQPVSLASLPALAAGTNGIGKLTANAGVTIGAVEIAAAQTLATVTNLSQLGGVAIAMGTGVRSAGTQRVTIATDDTVNVNITGGSSAGTEYTEDAAAAANPAGGMLIARRRDTLTAAEVSADGDNIALNATSKGELVVRDADTIGLVGGLTETAPASDTASSGLNGRLQRIAQRLTTMMAQLPTTLGIKLAANSLSVAPASDAVFSVAITSGATAGTEYTEDAATAANPVGGMLMARRRDTLTAAEVSADGDVIAVNSTSKGELVTRDADAVAGIGAIGDAAWSGTGNGSNNAVLKAIYAGSQSTNPVDAGQPADVISVTPTLDTSAYAAGDVLFATTAIAAAARANDEQVMLQSLAVIDKDDQKPAFKLFFFKASVTSGAFNGAPSISDADAANFLGSVAVAAADYDDLGGVSVASFKNIGLLLEPAAGTAIVYVFAVVSTTPTHTAAGLVLQFGLLQC